jgi:hypothetical protein
MLVRPLVGPLVRWSVGPLVRWSVGPSVPISLQKLITSQFLRAWDLVIPLFIIRKATAFYVPPVFVSNIYVGFKYRVVKFSDFCLFLTATCLIRGIRPEETASRLWEGEFHDQGDNLKN